MGYFNAEIYLVEKSTTTSLKGLYEPHRALKQGIMLRFERPILLTNLCKEERIIE